MRHGTSSQLDSIKQTAVDQQYVFVGFTDEECNRLKALGFVGVKIIENLLKQKQMEAVAGNQRNQG